MERTGGSFPDGEVDGLSIKGRQQLRLRLPSLADLNDLFHPSSIACCSLAGVATTNAAA
jgi:hypothetical protein